MKIEIIDPTVISKPWEYEGRAGTSHTQKAYLHVDGEPYPIGFNIKVQNPSNAYAPGVYVINLNESLQIYQGKLQLGTLVLIPAK
jgi:hypothetical protein